MAVFYDSESNTANITDAVIMSETTPVYKPLSGVYYYTTDSVFSILVPEIDFLNGDTYPAIQIEVEADNFGLPRLYLLGSELIGWNSAFDNQFNSLLKTDWAISDDPFYIVSTTEKVSVRTQDWEPGEWIESDDHSILVDTTIDNSTSIFHDFRTEDDRYTSTWTGWDSMQDLNSYDDNLGLQCCCSRLIYPSVDYLVYQPDLSPSAQPDYSGSTGNRNYFFGMSHASVSHSNGIFLLNDYNITESDLTNEYFKLEISLNGSDWFNCNQFYLGGALNDGDPCRVHSTVALGDITLVDYDSIAFTLGTGGFTDVSTGPDGWGIYCKITMTADITNRYLGSISLSTWI